MRTRERRLLRMLALGMAAVLLSACLPGAALALTAVTTTSTVVLQEPNLNSRYVWVPAGLRVNVLATRGNAVMVERNGIVGYMYLPHLQAEAEAQAPAAPEAPSTANAIRALTTTNTVVFQEPNLNSRYVWVPAGVGVYVLATNGNAAMVERNGIVGYMYLPHLLLEGQTPAAPQQASPQLPSVTDAYASGKYTNEQICYLFLTQVMGYNTAAAAGVLANIQYESGFNTGVVGDSGTSYGLCQWHASRKTRLANFCQQYGVGVDTLPAQLAYLKYELETYYPMVHNFLRSVSNTAEGAYQAGYYFCYNFEAPAARESQSTKRAGYAQGTLFGRYASV